MFVPLQNCLYSILIVYQCFDNLFPNFSEYWSNVSPYFCFQNSRIILQIYFHSKAIESSNYFPAKVTSNEGPSPSDLVSVIQCLRPLVTVSRHF